MPVRNAARPERKTKLSKVLKALQQKRKSHPHLLQVLRVLNPAAPMLQVVPRDQQAPKPPALLL